MEPHCPCVQIVVLSAPLHIEIKLFHFLLGPQFASSSRVKVNICIAFCAQGRTSSRQDAARESKHKARGAHLLRTHITKIVSRGYFNVLDSKLSNFLFQICWYLVDARSPTGFCVLLHIPELNDLLDQNRRFALNELDAVAIHKVAVPFATQGFFRSREDFMHAHFLENRLAVLAAVLRLVFHIGNGRQTQISCREKQGRVGRPCQHQRMGGTGAVQYLLEHFLVPRNRGSEREQPPPRKEGKSNFKILG